MSRILDDLKNTLQYGVANHHIRAQADGEVANIKFRAPGQEFGIEPVDLIIVAAAKLQEYENHVSVPERKEAVRKLKEAVTWLALIERPMSEGQVKEEEKNDQAESN